MSLQIPKPSKWYLRKKSISIDIWPNWIVKKICKHNNVWVVGKRSSFRDPDNLDFSSIPESLVSCDDCLNRFVINQDFPLNSCLIKNKDTGLYTI